MLFAVYSLGEGSAKKGKRTQALKKVRPGSSRRSDYTLMPNRRKVELDNLSPNGITYANKEAKNGC